MENEILGKIEKHVKSSSVKTPHDISSKVIHRLKTSRESGKGFTVNDFKSNLHKYKNKIKIKIFK